MKEAHKRGLIVNLWPGGSLEDFQLAVSLGSDIACTDYPQAVISFVKKKMKWVKPYNDAIK
jgi:glycerophosphoryl diester phosphodiesterase